jgi:hypothetical protein
MKNYGKIQINLIYIIYNNMNFELKHLLSTQIDSIESLQKLCSQNKEFFKICKQNTYIIAKNFLNKYQVDYTDPNNFIYIFNNANIKDYKDNNRWNLGSIFKLYMKAYSYKEIICDNMGITSFPIYPNMKKFNGFNNKLTSFPVQPNMIDFFGSNNKLTSFPVQPKMEYFEAYNNNLTSFPVQPKMEYFNALNNKLTSIPDQPNLEYYYCYADPGICE